MKWDEVPFEKAHQQDEVHAVVELRGKIVVFKKYLFIQTIEPFNHHYTIQVRERTDFA